MTRSDPSPDPLQFIRFAKSNMGNADQPGPLAQAFLAATQGPFGPGHFPDPPKPPYPNFWRVGCVFDTVLDYFRALEDSGQLHDRDRALLHQLVGAAVSGFQYGIVGLAAAWYDDWCWWGIAASKAFDPDYEGFFRDPSGPDPDSKLDLFRWAAVDLWSLVDSGDFSSIAERIPAEVWGKSAYICGTTPFTPIMLSARSDLHTGTRNAWALIQRGAGREGTRRQKADYSHFTTKEKDKWAMPRFVGGCWQYDLSTWAFNCQDGPDWANPDPEAQPLGVFQVTLMSGLYLSFCCSLMAAAERKAAEKRSGGAWDRLQPVEAYRKAADEVVTFLSSWIGLPEPDSLAKAFDPGVLVHERTPTYAKMIDYYPKVHGYHPDAYWGGDQGLIMGALKQYEKLTGSPGPANLAPCPAAILKGVFYNMPATDWAQPGAVGPYRDPTGKSPISGDSGDYGSGSGIFWRYVMRCCRLDPDFARPAKADPAIVAIATTSGTTAAAWGDPIFTPFNTVAAAIGAWYLLR